MLAQKKTSHKRIRPVLIGLAALLVVPMLMTFFALSPTANAARTQLSYSPYLTQVKQRAIALGIGGCIEARGTKGFGDNLTPQNVATGILAAIPLSSAVWSIPKTESLIVKR